MKVVPNILSISRMIFSLSLILLKPLSSVFYVIYIICGFTDILDGFIARKAGITSNFGAKLDSAADMVMICVLLIVIYPVVKPSKAIIIWIIFIALIRLTAMIVGFKKYKTFSMIHTYGNKITGLTLFLFPIFLSIFNHNVLVYAIFIIASISSIEELAIQLTSNQLQLNKKSILEK